MENFHWFSNEAPGNIQGNLTAQDIGSRVVELHHYGTPCDNVTRITHCTIYSFRDILYLLCSHNPEADECRSLGAGDVYMSGSAQAVSCLITVTVSLLFIFQCWYYKS